MTKQLGVLGLALALVIAGVSTAWVQGNTAKAAQQPDAEATHKDAAAKEAAAKEAQQRNAEGNKRAQERARLVPLSVDVVVSRYQAEKKMSSLP